MRASSSKPKNASYESKVRRMVFLDPKRLEKATTRRPRTKTRGSHVFFFFFFFLLRGAKALAQPEARTTHARATMPTPRALLRWALVVLTALLCVTCCASQGARRGGGGGGGARASSGRRSGGGGEGGRRTGFGGGGGRGRAFAARGGGRPTSLITPRSVSRHAVFSFLPSLMWMWLGFAAGVRNAGAPGLATNGPYTNAECHGARFADATCYGEAGRHRGTQMT